MTRRKRTPSPFDPSKRVAFEIPASLQQFSSISRSLATHTSPPRQTTAGRSTNSPRTQPRPISQSSSQPSPSITAPKLPNQSAGQNPPFSVARSWPRPVSKLSHTILLNQRRSRGHSRSLRLLHVLPFDQIMYEPQVIPNLVPLPFCQNLCYGRVKLLS